MKSEQYELLLDSFRMTGVYVIREDNHEILYFNKRVKEIAPDIKEGMVCHEVWKGACSNCPLLHIENKKEARSVNYDSPFGKAVEIVATRILWEEAVPAFMLAVTPYVEESNYIYHKVLRGNLSTDSFNIVKVDEKEMQDMRGHLKSLSAWLEGVALCGYIYEEDVERYRKFVQIERLKTELRNNAKVLNCLYRRRAGNRFRWHTLEIARDFDYTDDNQRVMIHVKDVHDIFRDGLEREEVNIRNQEIINSLGEMNFAIYVVDLQNGGVNIVQSTELVRQTVGRDIFLWDNIFTGKAVDYIASEDQEEFAHKFSLDAMRQAWENDEKKRTLVCKAFLHGEWRHISVTAYFKENQRQGGYAILTFQDVNEQTKKNVERAWNDRRMAAIIRLRYSIWNIVDLESGICERIYLREGNPGRREEGDYSYYIQKALDEFVVGEDKESFRNALLLENLRKKAEDVQNFKEEIFQYRYKGIPTLWVEEHVLYIRQGNKTVVNILGRDITSEKLEEERTRRDVLEKASIISSLSRMFFATYYLDLENDTFRPVTQKVEVENVLGDERSCAQAFRLYAQNFVHPDDREDYLAYVSHENLCNTLSRERPLVAFEYRRLPEQDNRMAWIRATVVLAAAIDGRPKQAVYVVQDVTESKLKEAQEQQALREACKAANHANAAKSEFMSRMSHDIRTPMNAIIGMTAIAGKYLEDHERVADCLGKITVSSKHLLSLVNDVLDMSKIESGKIDLAEEEINLSDLIANLVTMIRPSIDQKKHNFNVHIANVEHEHVIGDSMRIQQIFMNILGNAVKYTPPGGDIEMEINEKASSAYGYGCYEFIFRDNGIGMSREFQEKMFEPFSRAEDSMVTKTEGTGLGMTIARNIARMMDGDISVESTPGKGSQFVVILSFRIAHTTAPNTDRLVDLPVLVVDDDETASQMTCMILENIGMNGEYVLSGKEAVERVWEHHQTDQDYFSVILDWKMPDMDGIETAKAIRKKVGPDVPIIILSAYDWSDVEDEARCAGVNGFISKPLFKSRLVYLFNQIAAGDEEEEPLETELTAQAGTAGKRILLVEDNELNREIAEELIGETGVLVESAEDGRKALERFEQMPEDYYDMIFMDIQMPVMNGYEATAAIRELPREDASRIPIIAMTANAFAEDIRKCENAGMNGHLAKPLDIKQLIQCLKTWTGGAEDAGRESE